MALHHTAFVFPTHLRSEAYGLSLVEAAMFGKPMISCEIGTGTSFVNRNGETGIVVPPEDAEALAAAMARLSNDPDTSRSCGRRAVSRYADELQADLMVMKYIDLYKDLCL